MEAKYGKAEILNRVAWANHFRIIFGTIFFVSLIVMNAFNVSLREPTFVLIMIGLVILFYALLSHYYLTTQKPSLGEIVFLSFFLSLVDVVVITLFVYFSGGAESPYFVLYLLITASKLVAVPYFQQEVFVWAAVAAACYDAMLLLSMTGVLPVIGRNSEIIGLTPEGIRASYTGLFLIPALLFLFAYGVFLVGRVTRQERLDLQVELASEKELEKKLAAFGQIYWTLTHVFNLNNLLGEVLDKILDILDLSSGLIMVADRKGVLVCKASKNIPPELLTVFCRQKLQQLDISPANLKGIMIDNNVINHLLLKKLAFRNKTLGLMVIFCREGESFPNAKLQAALEPVVDELAAALYYGKLFRR